MAAPMATVAAVAAIFATVLLLEQRISGTAGFGAVQGLRGRPALAARLCGQDASSSAARPPSALGVQPPPGLAEVLAQVAPTREVLVVLSDSNMLRDGGMLQLWASCIQRLNMTNYLVLALDEGLRDYCTQHGINHFYRPVQVPEAQKGQRASQATAKFTLVAEFLALGYSVLLSDLDVVTLQDPFAHLHRDADLEATTDGATPGEAYGQIYAQDEHGMGWSVHGEGMQFRGLNVGFLYVRATQAGMDLMLQVGRRVARDGGWDQQLFNQELFRLSHGDYTGPQARVRVMDITKFQNSKFLFGWLRFQPRERQPQPVVVHMNYHWGPEKPGRMKAAIQFFVHNQTDALQPFGDKQYDAQLP